MVTFVLCAATAACGGYRLHNEYNMNVAQTLSILVRGRSLAVATCTLGALHACMSLRASCVTTLFLLTCSCMAGQPQLAPVNYPLCQYSPV